MKRLLHTWKGIGNEWFETLDELQANTVGRNAANTNADRLKTTWHHCNKSGYYRNQCRLLKRQKSSLRILKIVLETKTVAPILLSQRKIQTRILTTSTTKTVTERNENRKLFIHPVRHVEKQTTPQRKTTMERMQAIDRLPGIEDRKKRTRSKKANQNDSNEKIQAAAQNLNLKCDVFTPQLRLTDRRLLNFYQSVMLFGSNPRRLIHLKCIKTQLLILNAKLM